MIRNLKSLGLALVAVLAMSAVVASAASAAIEYTSSPSPQPATGSNASGKETFTTPGGTVQCNSHFAASVTTGSKSLTVTPSYETCVAFGFLNANVVENNCDYVFKPATKLATDHYSHGVDVSCPAGSAIVITAGTCEVQVPAQTGLSSVTTQNVAGGAVTVVPNVGSITMNVTKDGFGCPFTGTGHTTGTYHGHVTLSPTAGGSISVSGS
jgi:hypothetical protein